MVYEGVSIEEVYPYVLEAERELPIEKATVWHIRPQTVRTQNKEMAGYLAGKQKTPEAKAAHTTKVDRASFLRFMSHIERFKFYGEKEIQERVEDQEDLIRAFNQLDPNTASELSNASRDPFILREGQRKESPSLSGRPSPGKVAEEGGMTARDASIDTPEDQDDTA